ncbi:beta-glucuronidase [Halogranum amylolyticum]|uniref:Beta-glucuronidase n=1 Tax=Halogranum amylolyticum TaxID=660520 RepID=A0A1H8WEG6_9EURY|nr:glycoside hydrolase family 2 TIM barrel-domain containing protein [Halogranum amylolyticum]SEP25528.1 beta-glucuronidase [Halogranum amylolyticum]
MQLLAYPRETTSLDGTWQAIPDQYENFEGYFEDFFGDGEDDMPTGFAPKPIYEPEASVENEPCDFNIHDGRSVEIPSSWGEELPEFRHYEGWVWFAKSFDCDTEQSGARSFLRFGAVNYKAKVWLNGELLGTHEGGYTPFSFEVTETLQDGENTIVVQADNQRYEDGIPNEGTDWFNFGGINRSVELVTVPQTFVRNYKVETSLDDEVNVHVSAWVDNPQTETAVSVSFPELDREFELTPADKSDEFTGSLSFTADEVSLWEPSDPQLYTIRVATDDDAVVDEVGLREVHAADGDILLNGESLQLRGIALHEEVAGKGRALDSEDVATRFQWINELGCNFARLAHYPHTEEMARTADKEGILLWEEVPAYWDINFGDEDVQELYRQQLRELIQRDWNRASVILWSIANETDHTNDTRNKVLPQMADYVRELDSSRLVTAACFVDEDDDEGLVLKDPLEEHLDVIGINEYHGWYYGDSDNMKHFQEDPNGTPVVISETGGGAKWGHHGDEDERWTEEYQAAIYRGQTSAVADSDQIVGISPWILFDFRAPMRQNEFQRGYNRKGVLDQHGRKKKAFHVLREFYQSGHLE